MLHVLAQSALAGGTRLVIAARLRLTQPPMSRLSEPRATSIVYWRGDAEPGRRHQNEMGITDLEFFSEPLTTACSAYDAPRRNSSAPSSPPSLRLAAAEGANGILG